jgi:hypothetical protein
MNYAYQGFCYNELEIINVMTFSQKKMLIYACGCIEPHVDYKAYKFKPIVDVGAN